MTDPRVSVIMPVRDGERWIGEAIDSVLTQTFAELELIVIDDGSSDGTPQILADAARRDGRVRVMRQQRLGLVAALNLGLSLARGALIARLDADDVAMPRRIEQQLAWFGRQRDLVLLGTWTETIGADGAVTGSRMPEADPRRLRDILATRNPFVHSSVMFAANVARACGGYRPALEAAEDFDLWLRLSERGAIAMVPEVLVRYRLHPVGVSTRSVVRQLFSARLAIRSAAVRRSGQPDPIDALCDAPDWNSPADGVAFADAIAVARLLRHADPDCTVPITASEIRTTLTIALTHRERKLAQIALMNLASGPGGRSFLVRGECLARLFLLHPARAMQMLFDHVVRRTS